MYIKVSFWRTEHSPGFQVGYGTSCKRKLLHWELLNAELLLELVLRGCLCDLCGTHCSTWTYALGRRWREEKSLFGLAKNLLAAVNVASWLSSVTTAQQMSELEAAERFFSGQLITMLVKGTASYRCLCRDPLLLTGVGPLASPCFVSCSPGDCACCYHAEINRLPWLTGHFTERRRRPATASVKTALGKQLLPHPGSAAGGEMLWSEPCGCGRAAARLVVLSAASDQHLSALWARCPAATARGTARLRGGQGTMLVVSSCFFQLLVDLPRY